jgi:DNA-binding NarL/FixJ family response regulator
MIKIGLVDDEVLFLKGISELLKREEDLKVTQVYDRPENLLPAWRGGQEQPDILLMDVKMPGINGIELSAMVMKEAPSVKVIGLSSHYSKVLIFKMLNLGVSGFLPKNVSIDRLLRTIRNVQVQGFYFEDMVLKSLHENKLSLKAKKEIVQQGLTDREVDVLLLICRQMTNQEIADELFISLKTVERHRTNLFLKTGVKNVVGLVLFALEHEFIGHEFI